MGMLVVAVILGLILCALAYQADARFRSEDRLPMQWWLTGEVTWSAPAPSGASIHPSFGDRCSKHFRCHVIYDEAQSRAGGPRASFANRLRFYLHRYTACSLLADRENTAPTLTCCAV